jgi:hypothetical protein
MKFILCIIALLMFSTGTCANAKQVDLSNAIPLENHVSVPVQLEKAKTAKERAWGLMGRKFLEPNSGMLFIYPKPEKHSFWMFNCYIDLSIAYLDDSHVIREIADMAAYPQAMDPSRPVNLLSDLKKYPPDDPVCAFYESKSSSSKIKTKYALEMNRGWFKQKQIEIGDVVYWDHSDRGYINPAINLSPLLNNNPQRPLLIKLPKPLIYSVWMPEQAGVVKIAFLNEGGKIIQEQLLKGGLRAPPESKQVAVSNAPAAYLLITPVER